jgi:putative PIN family toxin of toxin-antitoxin system
MRLVIDTNVVISAALWGGIPRRVLEKAQSEHTLCFSLSMLQELQEVLLYPKFKERLAHLSFSTEAFLARLTEHAIVIANPREKKVIIEDPADNKFLACAVACKAQMIISGDEHLLSLKEYAGIPIRKPQQALRTVLGRR